MKNKLLKWFIILLPAIAILMFLIIIMLIPNKTAEEKKIKMKDVTTKDSRITFSVDENYKQEEKGEYDLYLVKNKLQIVTAFTYNLNEYEEKTAKEVLDKQVEHFTSTKKDIKLFKKETIYDDEVKKITKVEYSGKTDTSDECVYIFSVIEFKNDPNYIAYLTEVIIKNQYEDHIGEMIDIIKSAKLN